MNKPKRVVVFAGHYGSGKTNIAVNYALYLHSLGFEVAAADLDIVNPYFRTKDSAFDLKKAGIKLISPEFANTNVDLPALPSEIYGLVRQHDKYAVLDVGGDDRGALALGRFVPFIKEENNYEMAFVANLYRPLTQTAEEAYGVMKEIELAGGLEFTAVINNSNLGIETVPETVYETEAEIKKLCEISGLPLMMTTVEKSVAEKITGIENVFPLKLQNNLIFNKPIDRNV